MLSSPGLGGATGRAESMLGRRLRPWWGNSPGSLIVGGLVRTALFGAIAYYAYFQVRTGELDLSATGLEDQRDTIEMVAVWVAAGAVLAGVYNLIQVAIGTVDLVVRRNVEGQLLSAEERRSGDFLPGIVQHLWFRSHDSSGMNRSVRRRRRYEVVIATPRGPKSWNVKPNHFSKVRSRRGARVRLRVSPLLGYVSRIELLDAPTPSAPSGFDQDAYSR